MTERPRASWPVYALAALCAGAVLAAVLLVGPPSSTQASVTRTATVARGVVQSTVSGAGNLQPISQLDLGFKTSGTVTHIYVSQGQHVTQGQLLATLDPQSAEVILEQARASLQSAQANLAREEETDGEGSSAGGSSATGATSATSATGATASASASSATGPVNGTSPSPTTNGGTQTRGGTATAAPAGTTTTTSTAAAAPALSAATREANLASARAAVRSDTLTAQSDEQAVQDTSLYAPESGTIVSLAGQVGEVVAGGGTTRASSSSAGASGSTATATGGAGAATASRSTNPTGATASSTTASSSGSSSGSAFAVLSDLSSMQLVVALSESEIDHVEVGQIATVTVEALEGRKLAAHVSEVATLATSASGAVSYDVTFQLDQMQAGLKPGMSATAEAVVSQAEGVNVPTSAISAGQVTVERGATQVRRQVVTGLAGNSSTIVLSGLQPGETVVLPVASTSGSSATNVLSKIAGRGGGVGAGLGGAGLGGGGGGGGAFLRGGG